MNLSGELSSHNVYFWIAKGERYIQEAVASCSSVKACTNTPCVLFASNVDNYSPFDLVVKLKSYNTQPWFLESTRHMVDAHNELTSHEFRYAVYMDTDTFMCANVNDLFSMMQSYPDILIGGTHAPGRNTTKPDKPLHWFPELNIGVNPINLLKTRTLFSSWLSEYITNSTYYGDNDQGPLRAVLMSTGNWRNTVILPPEYNFRFGFGGQVCGVVRVFHGRAQNYPALSLKVNTSYDIRSWARGDLQ